MAAQILDLHALLTERESPEPVTLRSLVGFRVDETEAAYVLSTLRTALYFARQDPSLTVAQAVRRVHPRDPMHGDGNLYVPMLALAELAGLGPEGEFPNFLADMLDDEQRDGDGIPNTIDFLRESIDRIEAGERESHAP